MADFVGRRPTVGLNKAFLCFMKKLWLQCYSQANVTSECGVRDCHYHILALVSVSILSLFPELLWAKSWTSMWGTISWIVGTGSCVEPLLLTSCTCQHRNRNMSWHCNQENTHLNKTLPWSLTLPSFVSHLFWYLLQGPVNRLYYENPLSFIQV